MGRDAHQILCENRLVTPQDVLPCYGEVGPKITLSMPFCSAQGNVSVGESLSVGPGGVAVANRGSIRVFDGGLYITRSTTHVTTAVTADTGKNAD